MAKVKKPIFAVPKKMGSEQDFPLKTQDPGSWIGSSVGYLALGETPCNGVGCYR